MGRLVEDGDGSVDDNVGRCMAARKGFSFAEVNSVRASPNRVTCCHFSSDGKLLATGGYGKKVGTRLHIDFRNINGKFHMSSLLLLI